MRPLPTVGKHIAFPTEKEMRRFMLEAAAQFHLATGMPGYEISQRAMNDSRFLREIAKGRNFHARTFETFLLWLDDNWPATRGDDEQSAQQPPGGNLPQAD